MKYNRLLLNGNVLEENNRDAKGDICLLNDDVKAISFDGDTKKMLVSNFEDKKIAFYVGATGENSRVKAFMTFDNQDFYRLTVYFTIFNNDEKEIARYRFKLENGQFKLTVVTRFGLVNTIDRIRLNGPLSIDYLKELLGDAAIMVRDHSYYNKIITFSVDKEMIEEIASIPEIEREIISKLEEMKESATNAITRDEISKFLADYRGVVPQVRSRRKGDN